MQTVRNGGAQAGRDQGLDGTGRNPAVAWIASYFLVIPFAWRGFLSGQHSPFTNDIRHYHHPVTQELLRALHEGRLPLWTDHTFLGFPLFADPQTALWYPGTLLVAMLGPHWGYVAFLIGHSLLAAVGMFGWMRSHAVSLPAAWIAGLLVALSGYFAQEAQHPGLFAILCWMPAWLWTSHRVMRNATPGRVAAAALVVAMMIFAGTLQVLFGAVILYGFYLLGLFSDVLGRDTASIAVRRVAILVCAQILGLCLAAVTLVPALAHLQWTARALGMTYEFAAMGSAHLLELLGMFVNLGTTRLGSELQLDQAGASFYIGSLVLPLALVGLFTAKRRVGVAMGVAVAVLVMLAMGRHGWLHPWLFRMSPDLVGGLRGMVRALGPALVAVAFLVAVGLDQLRDPSLRVRTVFRALLIVGLVLHGMGLAYATEPLPISAFASGLALVLALAVSLFGARQKSKSAGRVPGDVSRAGDSAGRLLPRFERQSLVALLALDLIAFGALTAVVNANPEPPRTDADADVVPELEKLVRGEYGSVDTRVMLHGFGPLNLPMLHGMDGVGGYNPLVMLQYLDFVSLINNGRVFPRTPIDVFVSGSKPQKFQSALFNAAAIRFVISNRPAAARDLKLVEHYVDSHLASFGASLYENEAALPRAYLAYRTRRAADTAELERFLGTGFDGSRTTIVEEPGPSLAGPAEITPVARRGERPEERHFVISTERPAVLVVTDSWYPGWRAWIDGAETPVFRVNAIFKGVAVAAGAKRVEMRFEPWTFRLGATISLVASAVIVLLGYISLFRGRST